GWHVGVSEIFRSFDPTFKEERVHMHQNRFFRKYGKECKDKVSAFAAQYERDHVTGFAVDEDVLKIIREAINCKLYVWSSNTKKTVEEQLKKLNVFHMFDKIITSDDVFYIKPDPEGFSLVADSTPLNRYVFFGDSACDKEAAANVGIDYIDVKDL
ncbi:MAG: hypothetical protein A2946_00575, partial [Candidatus Liptonbacteria bacterium RIFCSPLOWO2_01_FULL_53_13]